MDTDTTGTRDRHGRSADAGMADRAGAGAVTIDTTIADIVRARPARSRVFEDLGIDYCCGGKRPLAEACRARGLEPAAVLAMLSEADAARDESVPDPSAMTLPELCDHIRDAHHGYLRDELPRLDFMTRKVAAVHGDREPRLLDVRRVFVDRLGGGEVAAQVSEACFPWLDAPVGRVGSTFTPVGFNRILERAVLPSTPKVLEAARRVLAF